MNYMNIRARGKRKMKSNTQKKIKNNYLLNFLKYMKYAKLEFIIVFVFLLLGIVFETLSFKIVSNVFDEKLQMMEKSIVLHTTFRIALFYLAVKSFVAFSIIVRKYMVTKAANVVYYNIQKEIYDHVQNLPIEYFDNIPAGSVLSKITSDANHIRNFFKEPLTTMFITLGKIVLMYSIMFVIDRNLSLIFLIFTPLILFLQRVNTKFTYPYITKSRAENSACSGLANEIFQNLEVVKAFNNEEKIIQKWEEHAKNKYKYDRIITKLFSLTVFNAFELLRNMVQLTIIFYYTYSSFNSLNWISASNILVFMFYSTNILNDITNFTNNISAYTAARGSAKNIYELLNLEVESDEGKKILDEFVGNIEFEDVSFAYKEDDYVLKNLNLSIKENESVAFVGHTGSGKTTIMNLIIKFYHNQKGVIKISGENLSDLQNDYLRSQIAIVLQDSFLFEGTLLSNICEDEELAKKCLELVGAKYLLDERGIHSEVAVDGSNFSTGERQLISFARALAKDPKILILDEATANVDSKTEQKIQHGIEVLKQNRTTLIIAHRLSTIRNVDRIYVLEHGVLKESGNHEELMAQNGIYKAMIEQDGK